MLFHVCIRAYYLAIKLSHLKFDIHVICLIEDCKRAVKISTCQIQMRSWLLEGMGAGTLIGLFTLRPNHTYG